MKIAHCQFEAWAGDFEHNLTRFEEGLTRADEAGAKVVTFPECFLPSYPDSDLSFKQDTAWSLTKSVWSFREFAPFVQAAMKTT